MKIGDLVDIHYSNGVVEAGKIANFDQHIVTVRLVGAPDAGAIIVPVWRLKPQGPNRWRLDL